MSTSKTQTAAELVWKTWHHVPFDNAAMTNAVVALNRDPLTNAAPGLLAALRELLTAQDDYPAIKNLPEMPYWTRARAAIAKAE